MYLFMVALLALCRLLDDKSTMSFLYGNTFFRMPKIFLKKD
jgi:hypothetical protein